MMDKESAMLAEILAELQRARTKFPGDNCTTLAMAEEAGELCTAVFEEPRSDVRKEAIQTAVMAMRVVLDGDATMRTWRAMRGLDPLVEGESMTGVEMIAMERHRQINIEGWTTEHDDQHTDESLSLVAALYASPLPLYSVEQGDGYFQFEDPWPVTWDDTYDGRERHDRLRSLVIAGALIAADIDRLQRATLSGASQAKPLPGNAPSQGEDA